MTHSIHITNGDIFNEYISKKREGFFIPFREAMIKGSPRFPLFDEAFCRERADTHSTDICGYKEHMGAFLALDFSEFDQITLWFGKDTFCQLNLLTVLAYLHQQNYAGAVYLNTIDDELCEMLIEKEAIDLSAYSEIYQSVFVYHQFVETKHGYLNRAIREYMHI